MEFQPPAAGMLTAGILLLICSTAETSGVRLVDGGDRCSGTPEILYEGTWVRASSKTFDFRAAVVVCRELDCGNTVKVAAARQAAPAEQSSGVMVDCTGHESAVSECIQELVDVDSEVLHIKTDVGCSGSVRLVDGAGLCSGRVEVKSRRSWTTVCEADFDRQDAEVVCRELGCGPPLTLQGALFGEGKLPFGTKEFQCRGTENRLLACSTSDRGNACTRGSALGLTCSGPDDVRLVDGSGRCAGTVEMFHSGQWRRVRTETWSMKEASVVCQQLDCGSAVAGSQTEALTEDTGWSFLTVCEGSEPALRMCSLFIYVPATTFATAACSGSVRLVDGAGLCSGRVEVKPHQSWTTVCEADFDRQDAEVVCRELGCGAPLTLQGALFGDGKLPFGTKEFQCRGTENRLGTCSTSDRGSACTRGGAVGLTCSEPDVVRLVGGGSRCAGKVEVFHGGQWRQVEGDRWTKIEAAVVCGQLGCGSVVVSTGTDFDDPGETVAWVTCERSEASWRECTVLGASSTGSNAEVVCSGVLGRPTISVSCTGSKVLRGHNFIVTCSTQLPYPGGSFDLKLPWSNRSHTQTAVNHSASFFFPAANDSHQGNYSCVYRNQVAFQEASRYKKYIVMSEVTHNFSGESEPLALVVADSPLPAAITRILLVPALMLVACLTIFLVFKKWGHIFIRFNSGQEGAAFQYDSLQVRVEEQQDAERRPGEKPPTDLELKEEEEQGQNEDHRRE